MLTERMCAMCAMLTIFEGIQCLQHDVTFVSRGDVSELFQIETRCLGLFRDIE